MTETVHIAAGREAQLAARFERQKTIPREDLGPAGFAALLAGMLTGTEWPHISSAAQEVSMAEERMLSAAGGMELTSVGHPAVPAVDTDGEPAEGAAGPKEPVKLEETLVFAAGKERLPSELLSAELDAARGRSKQAAGFPGVAEEENGVTAETVARSSVAVLTMDGLSAQGTGPAATERENLEPGRPPPVPGALGADEPIAVQELLKTETAPKAMPASRTSAVRSQAKEQAATALAAPRFTIPEGIDLDREENRLSLTEASRLFRQALKQASRQQGSGRQEVTLKLDPPNLGQVRLTLLHRTGVVSARFQVENNAARGALESNMTELKESLVQQGIKVEELTVFIGQGGTDNNQFYQGQDRFPSHPSRTLFGAQPVGIFSDHQDDRPVWAQGTLDLLI